MVKVIQSDSGGQTSTTDDATQGKAVQRQTWNSTHNLLKHSIQTKDFACHTALDEIQALLLTDDDDKVVVQLEKTLSKFQSFTKKLQDPSISLAYVRMLFGSFTEKEPSTHSRL